MRIPSFVLLSLALALLGGGWLRAQGDRLPEGRETTLRNGVKVLTLERPGSSAIHARIFLRSGRSETGRLPPVAADLLARTLFGRILPEGHAGGGRLEALLKQEEGAFEALRLERLRQARSASGDIPSEYASLLALHQKSLDELHALAAPVERWDALDALGATGRQVTVAADFLSFGVDLPATRLGAWCQLQAGRLHRPPLEAFPLERDRLARELEAGLASGEGGLSVLLATALAGQAYARVAELRMANLEAVTWSDLKAYARWMIAPERILLVLAGDLRREEALPLLEKTFGSLGPGMEEPDLREHVPPEMGDATGARRLQASTPGANRIYMGWRVPPANHPDTPALQVLAQILGGGASSRLWRDLKESRAIARRVSVKVGVPGGRDLNLLVIEAEPLETRSLDELELFIQGEVLRLQREPIQDLEIRRAQLDLETAQLLLQEDAAELARAAGEAACQGGDWRLAFQSLSLGRTLTQAELQDVARRYLVPSRATTALLGPDPMLQPADRLEARLVKALTTLVQARLDNPVEMELVVRETLKQMRMLTTREREETLKLLEAQVKP